MPRIRTAGAKAAVTLSRTRRQRSRCRSTCFPENSPQRIHHFVALMLGAMTRDIPLTDHHDATTSRRRGSLETQTRHSQIMARVELGVRMMERTPASLGALRPRAVCFRTESGRQPCWSSTKHAGTGTAMYWQSVLSNGSDGTCDSGFGRRDDHLHPPLRRSRPSCVKNFSPS